MGTVPPRVDDEEDERHWEKARAGGWRTLISANEAMTTTLFLSIETARKFREGAKRRGLLGIKKRQSQLAEDREKQQVAADEIWSRRPDLSVNAVAGMVASKCDAKQETVRKHIRKPEATH